MCFLNVFNPLTLVTIFKNILRKKEATPNCLEEPYNLIPVAFFDSSYRLGPLYVEFAEKREQNAAKLAEISVRKRLRAPGDHK
jgi:hypothetical protein